MFVIANRITVLDGDLIISIVLDRGILAPTFLFSMQFPPLGMTYDFCVLLRLPKFTVSPTL